MDGPAAAPGADGSQARAGLTPWLELDGFSGALDQLLALARAHKVELARVSPLLLVDQVIAAQAPAVPLGQRADWVVMAAWLLQLLSQRLLPAPPPGRAADQPGRVHVPLTARQAAEALARWLQAQPQLGHDVFARGRPEVLTAVFEDAPEIDVVEFLWAAMGLFDDDLPGAALATRYRPAWLELYSIAEARSRILRRLADTPDGQPLGQLLPEMFGAAEGKDPTPLMRRLAWASTLTASLELAKQGAVLLDQEWDLAAIHVVRSAGETAS